MLIKKYYLTKHFNTRIGDRLENVKYIVITSSIYSGYSALKNRNIMEKNKFRDDSNFSCHYIIDDKKILQIIPQDEVAICTGNLDVDYNSISIMLTTKENEYYSKKQIEKLESLVKELREKYNVKKENIILEYDINGARRPKYIVDERILLEEIIKDEA